LLRKSYSLTADVLSDHRAHATCGHPATVDRDNISKSRGFSGTFFYTRPARRPDDRHCLANRQRAVAKFRHAG